MPGVSSLFPDLGVQMPPNQCDVRRWHGGQRRALGRARAEPFTPPAELGWVSILLSFAVPRVIPRDKADPSAEPGFF